MKIGYLQYDVQYRDVEKNIQTIEKLLDGFDADVMVLPELAFSGYYFESKKALRDFIKPYETYILERLQNMAQRFSVTLIAGSAERDEAKLYNTLYVVDASGLKKKYRKRHLTDNETIFDAGDTLEVVDIQGVKFGLGICFDSWFFEHARLLSLKGAEIIVYPSNFGGPWTPEVIRVRSLENSVFTVLSNRIGSEMIEGEDAAFSGGSFITDTHGNLLTSPKSTTDIQVVHIDPKDANQKATLICGDMEKEHRKYDRFIKVQTKK